MGVTVNAVKGIGASFANAGAGVGKGAQCPLRMVEKTDSMNRLAENATLALD